MSMPNKHHFLVDLSPFGLDNPNEVYYAADRPYGLIEGTVTRDDAPPAGRAWQAVPGFCLRAPPRTGPRPASDHPNIHDTEKVFILTWIFKLRRAMVRR